MVVSYLSADEPLVEGLDILARGVGRTGLLEELIIHDFCRDPPKSVFNVALEDSTSVGCPSLFGGLRISHQDTRQRTGFVIALCQSRLANVSVYLDGDSYACTIRSRTAVRMSRYCCQS
jgi:hypothetical protein